jgi:hypothetical protein
MAQLAQSCSLGSRGWHMSTKEDQYSLASAANGLHNNLSQRESLKNSLIFIFKSSQEIGETKIISEDLWQLLKLG